MAKYFDTTTCLVNVNSVIVTNKYAEWNRPKFNLGQKVYVNMRVNLYDYGIAVDNTLEAVIISAQTLLSERKKDGKMIIQPTYIYEALVISKDPKAPKSLRFDEVDATTYEERLAKELDEVEKT